MSIPAAQRSEAVAYRAEVWRIVEGQRKASTVRITDTLAEQELLEIILEESKPALPEDCAGLDYLLATPFRYSPYPHGSRFRRALQHDGAFYASENLRTAVSELAFYRFLFFAESPDSLRPRQASEHTAFSVRCFSQLAQDLTKPPYEGWRDTWTAYADYGPCQDFADQARAEGIELLRYESVRNPPHGRNVALLSVNAFADKAPRQRQTWRVFMDENRLRAWCDWPSQELEFSRDQFADDPRL